MSAYVPTDWVDGSTPVNAVNLDKLEQGLAAASQDALDAAADAVDALAGNPPDPTGLDEKWLKAESGAMVWVDPPAGGGVGYENDWAAGTAYEAGDVVRYNGVDYLAVNPSTGQTPPQASPAGIQVVTSLPLTPYDGQECILVDVVGAATFAWRLRYSAARATNRWVFVGGVPKVVESTPEVSTASTTFVPLDGPSFAAPVPGIYHMRGEANKRVSAVNTASLGLFANAVEILTIPTYVGGTGVPLFRGNGSREVTVAAAGHVLALYYKTSAGTSYFSYRRLEVIPFAVGG